MAALISRGDSLLGTGDFVSARLFYERAANAGSGEAALRLGETYDPQFLAQAHLRGARGNIATAVFWYKRARDLGTREAEILLGGLPSN
ncbi:MAG: sel1 repeat family protein [Alphaproteobacteria bacterium]|nr:MAG: sel1 repeat family protein [Alphaproteobacteria bacterium]